VHARVNLGRRQQRSTNRLSCNASGCSTLSSSVSCCARFGAQPGWRAALCASEDDSDHEERDAAGACEGRSLHARDAAPERTLRQRDVQACTAESLSDDEADSGSDGGTGADARTDGTAAAGSDGGAETG